MWLLISYTRHILTDTHESRRRSGVKHRSYRRTRTDRLLLSGDRPRVPSRKPLSNEGVAAGFQVVICSNNRVLGPNHTHSVSDPSGRRPRARKHERVWMYIFTYVRSESGPRATLRPRRYRQTRKTVPDRTRVYRARTSSLEHRNSDCLVID